MTTQPQCALSQPLAVVKFGISDSLVQTALVLVLRVITLVMACRIVTPAFSISFLDRADVTQMRSAGWANHAPSLGLMAWAYGLVLVLVIRTPLARTYAKVSLRKPFSQ
jgi:hypothetical protein